VDCFYQGDNMLVINPDECIDCGVCVPECPAEAIFPESEDLVKWTEFNREYSEKWPVITKQQSPLPDADKFDGEKDKLSKYFKGK
jgi:ferredoxin